MLSLVGIGIIGPTSVAHAEDLTTQASVNVAKDPNGTLTLQNVSPEIHFGTLQLDATKKTVSKSQETDVVASVLDTRGTGQGWTLQVAYDASVKDNPWKTADGAGILKGAELIIDPSKSDLTHDGSADFATEDAPKVQSAITVNGAASNVYVASNAQGLGEWTGTFSSAKAGMNLTIPSISIAGQYQSKLDWTLLDTPQ